MLKKVAFEYYGDKRAEAVNTIAALLDITVQSVYQWGDLVPPVSAARLAKKSRGALTFDPDAYARWNKGTRKERHK
jgi:hypothetical protein